MSDDFKEWSNLVLHELKRSDQNHRDVMQELSKLKDGQVDQGNTLIRLTTTVEEHKKYSINLEKEQKAQRATQKEINEEVDNINTHVNNIKIWVKILTPTKTKIAIIIVIGTLLGIPEIVKFVKMLK
jgi:hypothetical protein